MAKLACLGHLGLRRKKTSLLRLVILLILGFLLFGCWLTPVWSQTAAEKAAPKATIFLDGHPLFEIAGSGNFSAEERALQINELLQKKVDRNLLQGQPVAVRLVEQGGQPTLRVNDRYLLTVTKADVMPGMPLTEQGQIWQQQIQAALKRALQERTPAYQQRALKLALLAVSITVVLQALLFWEIRRFRRWLVGQFGEERASWRLLGLYLLQIVSWLAAICYVAYLFPLSRRWLCDIYVFLGRTFSAELVALGEETLSLNRILALVAVAIFLWIGIGWLVQLLKTKLLPVAGVDRSLQDSISFFTRYMLLALGLLLVLNAAGLDLMSLAILFGFIGVGIGFGLQNIAKDFISGLLMIVERPIKVGELVQVGDFQGLVQRIGARTTEMTNIDRVTILIPNSRFIEGEVQNWNRSGLTRVKVYVGVAYNSDVELVTKALLAAAQVYHPDILKHPPPKVKLRGFEENSLSFRVVVFIRDPLKEPKVREHIHNQVEAYLRKYGIQIPYPQRDLHIKLPQLEQIAEVWLQKNALPDSQPAASAVEPRQDASPLPLKSESKPIEAPRLEEEYDWEKIVAKMRGPEGVEIRDRRYGFRVYRRCFVGSEAVKWLIENEKATRQEAIMIGELMIAMGIIHHVLDEHGFRDEPLFYRFYADEEDMQHPTSQVAMWQDSEAGVSIDDMPYQSEMSQNHGGEIDP